MRVLPLSTIGVLSAAALLTPLVPPASALSDAVAPDGAPATRSAAPRLAGSTQSLPLRSLRAAPRTGGELELAPRTVRPFSLLGLVWQNPHDQLSGQAQVRVRSERTGLWSGWHELDTHSTHAPDEASRESARGSTSPLWTDASDGVQLRVRADKGATLPAGLRLDLVDPGDASLDAGRAAGPGADRGDGAEAASGGTEPDGPEPDGPESAGTEPDGTEFDGTESARADRPDRTAQDGAGPAVLPALSRAETVAEAEADARADAEAEAEAEARGEGTARGLDGAEATVRRHIGPRPGIVTRKGWGADPDLRDGTYLYTRSVKTAFVHHTAESNNYRCSQAPSIIRGIYRYHVRSNGWRDIGYNFLIDKCGKIYEGRAGGVTEAVQGAHTYGFNHNSMGIAVLGSFGGTNPSRAAQEAVAKLTAWKLGRFGVNAKGTSTRISGGGKYAKGKRVRLHTVSGHRDGFGTECPGARLYNRLDTIRATAGRLQGR